MQLSLATFALLTIVSLASCSNSNSQPQEATKAQQQSFEHQSRNNNVKGQPDLPRRQTATAKKPQPQAQNPGKTNNNHEHQPSVGRLVGANVFPSKESDANSQVVYVNFGRVVNDGVSSANDSQSFVTSQSSGSVSQSVERPIKRDYQIPCGETNRNGHPSLEGAQSSDPSIPDRIVGGNKADPGEFPFQVRLNIRSRRGSSLCGGVIIDKRHILTAAHCMTTCSGYVMTSTVEPSSIQATIGDLKITVADGEQTVGIERVTAHQQYSACSFTHNNYDLAILKTSRPMSWKFTQDGHGSVNRICLPRPRDDYRPGENVTVTGWGVMDENEGRISNNLQMVELPVVSLDECRSVYGQRVNRDHVCAGLSSGGKDSCQGDSGGPLFRRVGGQMELIGVVSFGYGCAQPGTPGVYTKISHYIDWIERNM